MRKERNDFFQESSYNQGYYHLGNFIPQVPPMPQMEASSSFYMSQNMNPLSDINERLSKIERNINRLESRINKLETSPKQNITNEEIDASTNMYMI